MGKLIVLQPLTSSTWTPPLYFCSLALYRRKEYAKAGVPMLP